MQVNAIPAANPSRRLNNERALDFRKETIMGSDYPYFSTEFSPLK